MARSKWADVAKELPAVQSRGLEAALCALMGVRRLELRRRTPSAIYAAVAATCLKGGAIGADCEFDPWF
eukprot:6177594-Pleurochrysis_carterae.AAC.2